MKNKTLWIVIAVIVLVIFYGWSVYNGLVSSNENVTTAWAQVETQYQRRVDLIPNLVESVKGVMKQEQSIFTALAEARTKYTGATSVNEKAAAAGQVDSALGRLLAVVENYPQLKSSETVQTLMAQIEGTENRVSVERNRFNETVRAYNLTTKRFPSSVIASIFGFGEKNYFAAAAGAENAPKVSF
jgi:LemA protein